MLRYVESARGYHNLNRLLSHRAEEEDDDDAVAAQRRKPFARERLAGFTDGLIAVSADPRLAELFPDRFYRLAKKAGLPHFSGTRPPPRVSGLG